MSSIQRLIAQVAARKPSAKLPPQPKLRTAILTCMDARIDPVALFGLSLGDAHVLRNAGARATPDVMRSLALSQAILGTREVLVLGHTGCGLLGRTERELAEEIRIKSGHRPDTELGTFQDLDRAVGATVEALRRCAFLVYRNAIHGYVYDVDEGTVRPITNDESQRRTARPLDLLRADVLDLKANPRRDAGRR